jgi:hypothetical protein
VNAALSDLTIADGNGDMGGGIVNGGTLQLANCNLTGNYAFDGGGGIYNSGTATLTNCILSGNSSMIWGMGFGGAINNYGTVILANCTLSGNSVSYGGGIDNSGTVILADCTLSGNSARFGGGGIYNYGTATLTNSTLSGNDAAYGGGGVYNYGTVILTNCTLFGNSVTYGGSCGGGIYNYGTVILTNCTLSGNSAGAGGGIYNYGTAALYNSIVANSGPGGDIAGPGTLHGSHNLVEDGSGLPDWLTGNTGLGELQDNGGPTWTCALLPGAIAIDAGDNSLVPDGVTTDQCGRARIVGKAVDLGAFEFWGTPTNPTEPTVATDHGPAVPLAESSANSVVVDSLMSQLNAVGTAQLLSLPGAAPVCNLAFLPQHIGRADARLTLADNGGTDQSALVDVQGIVFSDCNRDGFCSSGEPGLGGRVVRLIDESGFVVTETTTDPEGEYHFDGVPAGRYRVEAEPGPEWAGAVSPAFAPESGTVTVNPLALPPTEDAADEGTSSTEAADGSLLLLGAALPMFLSRKDRRLAAKAARYWAN